MYVYKKIIKNIFIGFKNNVGYIGIFKFSSSKFFSSEFSLSQFFLSESEEISLSSIIFLGIFCSLTTYLDSKNS